ncbi:TIGR04141 family sporadically distributed protein [Streptococcus mitis]|uniref:TIGR04141 family sporadically distributed protein n=1 Tax=Streptococcus mitis TaxID=28037 RepID=UPI0021B5190E|nr:TIGR04141 family sporadically distributed protein [Streptococcus mitis]
MTKKLKTTQISLFLNNKSVEKFEDCLKDKFKYDEYPLNSVIGLEGKIFVHNSDPKLPSWQDELNQLSAKKIKFSKNVPNKAVVVVKFRNRFFSITYGYGRSMLNDLKIVRNFGLKVAANLIDKDKIRSMNITSIEDVIVSSQRQSSIYASQDIFDLDTRRNLLQSVSGAPSLESVASFLVGTDSLVASRKMNITDIKDSIGFYYDSYKKDDYKNNGFSWLDNILEVREKRLSSDLDNQLYVEMTKGNYPTIAPNTLLDWENIEGFFLTGTGKREKEFSIEIDSNAYFSTIRRKNKSNSSNSSFISSLKRNKLVTKYKDTDEERIVGSLYSSLIFEIDYNKEKYILCYGSWYKINKEFFNTIKTEIDNIVDTELPIVSPASNGQNEGDFNKAFSTSHPDYYILDKEMYHGDSYGRSSVEVADIVTKDKKLIHVKKGGSSSKLSHLFSQGVVSATILAQDIKMKEFINEKCGCKILNLSETNNEFEIVFAIIDKRVTGGVKNSDILPFFSMVNLFNAIQQLKSMGFKYSILKIPVV